MADGAAQTVKMIEDKANALVWLDRFLSIYPLSQRREGIEALWQAGLLSPLTVELLIEIHGLEDA